MKVMAVIVFYNPGVDAINNYNNLKKCDFFNEVMVLDNSNEETKIELDEHIIYKCYKKNLGIAEALYDGMEYAKANNYDYVLTLDQDSIFPFEKMNEIEPYLLKHMDDSTGIIALNYNDKYKSKKDEINLKYIITSGNFVSVKSYSTIEGFNKDLFIDYVDFDLCRQLYYANKKIILLPKYSIKQTIGNPIYKKIFFLKIKSMNASLIRYYYRFRNLVYCYKKNKRFYFKKLIQENITIILMLLFESNKKNKMKMIKKGKKDGKRGILGPFKE